MTLAPGNEYLSNYESLRILPANDGGGWRQTDEHDVDDPFEDGMGCNRQCNPSLYLQTHIRGEKALERIVIWRQSTSLLMGNRTEQSPTTQRRHRRRFINKAFESPSKVLALLTACLSWEPHARSSREHDDAKTFPWMNMTGILITFQKPTW